MSVKRIPGQDARFGTLYVNASDYDRLAISHQSALDDCKASWTERDALSSENLRMREAALDVISNLGEWCCGLQSQEQVDYVTEQLDKLHEALSSGKEVG